jgi:hypothetical protein
MSQVYWHDCPLDMLTLKMEIKTQDVGKQCAVHAPPSQPPHCGGSSLTPTFIYFNIKFGILQCRKRSSPKPC